MNVSDQLLSILQQEGVKHVFGVAGDALNPLVDAIGKQDTIKWIKVKHEGNGSFAAFAQGELGDTVGVCASTVGPGALHLVNGLYNAKKERSPVVAITGQIPVEHLKTNYHQEVDLEKTFEDICDYQGIIRSPEEAPRVILRAIRIAINHRAVCRIELPADIAEMPAANNHLLKPIHRSKAALHPDPAALVEAVSLIRNAETIGILAGAGCRNAREQVLDLAGKLKAPIVHTVRASDIFDHSADHVVGLTGLIGNPAGYKAVMESDLLIMLGTDFPYTNFLPKKGKVIQVDIRAENIGNRTAADVGIHGDMKVVAEELNQLVEERQQSDFYDSLRASFKEWLGSNQKLADPARNGEPLHPQIFAGQISDQASDDAVFVIDTGTAAIWSSNFMNFHSERRIIGSFNHGSMSVGLPAAIGAQLLKPEREVWALVGDGAFHMSMQDFTTAVEYDLPIKIIVLNNEELGFVKIEMEEAGLAPNYDALGIESFDFAGFAELCGGRGLRVDHAEDIQSAIKEAKHSTGPILIDARVTGGELSLPPKIGFKEAYGFGTSKVKEVLEALKGDKRQWDNLKKEVEAFFDR
jgi:thiamine pyrophosphate-dependent acetolactate synthase large subunit-like protein